ncbi:hypothetical protein GVO57_01755 [Sphingomonas changnyeongensis]|uniref:Uncharacterized protein n=1 Tax=Sphingomonas changnyeongensis TaxID=2698679 RepID=A0A7Z2NTX2_9SPHN|nr:hypothetical protein [Sphingomonas changnyeongensis]QHL89780.1 hypothetical protein GVO57_01755 [Sphingomonas changnyeongensis]
MPLLLTGCLLTPGKFSSRLTVNADRSFTFSYQGEVIALDPDKAMSGAMSDAIEGAAKNKAEAAKNREAEGRDNAAKNAALAEALGREAGYRSVRYLGGNRFLIDYQLSGTLSHGFVFPFNSDAGAIFPFLSVELRANGTVRVKAPGFAADDSGLGRDAPGMNRPASEVDGVFVIDTDAEIVSQNSEDGATAGTEGRRLLSWKATPLTRDAPTAVLRLK